MPVTGVLMRVFAAPFRGEAPNAAVTLSVEVDPSTLSLVEKDGVFVDRLQVMFSATDSRGKVHPGDVHTVNLALKPDTYARAQDTGLRVISQMSLPAGRYQLRVAAGTQEGKAGSVVYDLEIPDFRKGPLSMSGVAVTSVSAARTPTVKPKDPLAGLLPGPPSALREFERGDTIALFAEFYENDGPSTVHTLEFKAELREEGGRAVREQTDERSSSELQGKAGGYGFSANIPLDGVTPGLYVLRVTGQSRVGDRASVSRDILIRVR